MTKVECSTHSGALNAFTSPTKMKVNYKTNQPCDMYIPSWVSRLLFVSAMYSSS